MKTTINIKKTKDGFDANMEEDNSFVGKLMAASKSIKLKTPLGKKDLKIVEKHGKEKK